jgi:hypothetical protein
MCTDTRGASTCFGRSRARATSIASSIGLAPECTDDRRRVRRTGGGAPCRVTRRESASTCKLRLIVWDGSAIPSMQKGQKMNVHPRPWKIIVKDLGIGVHGSFSVADADGKIFIENIKSEEVAIFIVTLSNAYPHFRKQMSWRDVFMFLGILLVLNATAFVVAYWIRQFCPSFKMFPSCLWQGQGWGSWLRGWWGG